MRRLHLLLILAVTLPCYGQILAPILQKAPSGTTSQDPNAIGSDSFWYRSDSLTCTGGCSGTNTVTVFVDKSANARNSNSCTSGCPTYLANVQNSLPGVNFASSTYAQALSSALSATTSHSVFAVIKTGSSVAVNAPVLGVNACTAGQYFASHSNGKQFVYESGSGDSTTAMGTSQVHLIMAMRNGTTITYYLDGSVDGTTSSGGGTSGAFDGPFYDGCTGTNFNGVALELAEFSKELSTTERKNLCNYASTYWGLGLTCN